MGNSRGRQAFYGAAVFLSSAGGLVLEIVAGRLLAPYVGMSLYTWTAIIAVVLAGSPSATGSAGASPTPAAMPAPAHAALPSP